MSSMGTMTQAIQGGSNSMGRAMERRRAGKKRESMATAFENDPANKGYARSAPVMAQAIRSGDKEMFKLQSLPVAGSPTELLGMTAQDLFANQGNQDKEEIAQRGINIAKMALDIIEEPTNIRQQNTIRANSRLQAREQKFREDDREFKSTISPKDVQSSYTSANNTALFSVAQAIEDRQKQPEKDREPASDFFFKLSRQIHDGASDNLVGNKLTGMENAAGLVSQLSLMVGSKGLDGTIERLRDGDYQFSFKDFSGMNNGEAVRYMSHFSGQAPTPRDPEKPGEDVPWYTKLRRFMTRETGTKGPVSQNDMIAETDRVRNIPQEEIDQSTLDLGFDPNEMQPQSDLKNEMPAEEKVVAEPKSNAQTAADIGAATADAIEGASSGNAESTLSDYPEGTIPAMIPLYDTVSAMTSASAATRETVAAVLADSTMSLTDKMSKVFETTSALQQRGEISAEEGSRLNLQAARLSDIGE